MLANSPLLIYDLSQVVEICKFVNSKHNWIFASLWMISNSKLLIAVICDYDIFDGVIFMA